MQYIIYKTTNIVDGRYYIGAHRQRTKDNYLGSGRVLQAAIKKHGVENFIRETLEVCESEEHMFLREEEIVTNEIVEDRNSYNIATGGKGGPGTAKTEEHKQKIRDNHQHSSNPGAGRPPATDPKMLVELYHRVGGQETAKQLGISFEACKHRYYRMRNK